MSKLLEEVRDLIRTLQYTYRTEEACLHWIRQYILFHGKRHPTEMGAAEVSAFLTHLAVNDSLNSESGARGSSVSL